MKDLKIGVIGTGKRSILGKTIHELENIKVTAGADIDPDNLRDFGEKVEGASLHEDYREMLEKNDLDAVIITSPDHLHEEHAIASLEAGKAVYLEKPLAITIESCDRILETAVRTKGKLMLGHNMRYVASVLKMKEIIDSEMIGEIQAVWCRHFVSNGGDWYFKDWHSEQQYATSLLLQKASHDIDVIHWLAGAYTQSVVGMGKLSVYDKCARRSPDEKGCITPLRENWPPKENKGMSPVIDVEDHSMIMMQLDNGVQASYTQCHYTPDNWRNYTFIGTKGRLENIGITGDCQIAVYNTRSTGFTEPDILFKLKAKEGGHGGSDPDILNAFAEYVRTGKKPNTSAIAARQSVAAGVLGTKSLRETKRYEEIPPLSDEIIKYFED